MVKKPAPAGSSVTKIQPATDDTTVLRKVEGTAEGKAEGTAEAWRLDLTPVDPRAGRLLRRVAITGTGADVQEVLLMQANGDEQRMTITATP